MDEACHADGEAAATLNIASMLHRAGFINLAPETSRSNRDCRERRKVSRRTQRPKPIVHFNGPHLPHPDEKRASTVRISEIAVATAFDDRSDSDARRIVDR